MALGKGKRRPNRPIHVEPHPMAMTKGRHGPKGVDGSPHGGARRGHHGNHGAPRGLERFQAILQIVDLQAPRSVDRDQLQRFRRQAHHR